MFQTLRKYMGLYAAFFRASFIGDLEYRANFITRIATDIIWYAAQIVAFETIYRHTKLIGNWNVQQMRVFLGMMFVIDAIYMITLHDNLDRFSDKVRKGELDLILAKPVNSQFMVSFQRTATALIGNFLIACGWLAFSLSNLPDFSPMRLLWLLILVPSGFAVLYSLRFAMSALALIFTKADNIQFIWYQIYKLGGFTGSEGRIVDEAMRATGVDRFASRSYTKLSAGERARVQLARVLAQIWEPLDRGVRFLLLDEPTASLDLAHQHDVLAAIRGFAASGAGVVMVLHDLNLALRYADRVLLMKQGRIDSIGRSHEVLDIANIRRVFDVEVELLSGNSSEHPWIAPKSRVVTADGRAEN